jgi:hypothetical protein
VTRIIAGGITFLMISACATAANERRDISPRAAAAGTTCPVTIPPRPGLVPPDPYPPEPPSSLDAVWYGTPELWTALDRKGPGRQVLRAVRRGLLDRRAHRGEDARSGTQGKRVRGALGRHRSTRVPRPRPDLRPTSPAAGPRRLRRALQQCHAAPEHRASTAGSRSSAKGVSGSSVRRRDILGGLIHEYDRVAA